MFPEKIAFNIEQFVDETNQFQSIVAMNFFRQ